MLAFSPFLKINLAITMTWWWPLSDELVYVSTSNMYCTYIHTFWHQNSQQGFINNNRISFSLLFVTFNCLLSPKRTKAFKIKMKQACIQWVGNQIWNCQIEMYWKRININKWTQYINLSLLHWCVKTTSFSTVFIIKNHSMFFWSGPKNKLNC